MSDRRTEANRLNAKKSTGPRTPEGKRRSSRNALKHGILSKARLLPDESPEAFAALLDSWIDRLQPLDSTEARAVEDIVTIEWHILRIRNIESDLLQIEHNNPALDKGFSSLTGNYRVAMAYKSLAGESGALHLANRQLSRLSRELNRRLKMFAELRREFPPVPCDDPAPASPPRPPVPEHTEVQFEPIDISQFWGGNPEDNDPASAGKGRFSYRTAALPGSSAG